MTSSLITTLLSLGDRIFLTPSENKLLKYDQIINGVIINRRCMSALAGNTFRAFPRIDISKPGASLVFRNYFSGNQEKILAKLKEIKNRDGLDDFLNPICTEIENELKGIIINTELGSFNKVRKPVDITIEHIVAMAKEVTNAERKTLVPLLRLPLDSWMFEDKTSFKKGVSGVFQEEDLHSLKITRKFSFKNITTDGQYNTIQKYLVGRSGLVGDKHFYPIYFDLLWRDRYKKHRAEILFETN